jgi:hypothetical protein
MHQLAGISKAARVGAFAMLLSSLALAGCSGSSKAMDEKLAAAQAAADRAVAAQHAAEQAAAAAGAARSAPVAQPLVSDLPPPDSDNGNDNGSDQNTSMGGAGQTVGPDGTVVPGPG